MPQAKPRRVDQRNTGKRRTKAQADLIRDLRRQLNEPRRPIPKTRGKAAHEIDRLLIALGRQPRAKQPRRKSYNQRSLEISIARDQATERLKTSLRTEQADLKAQAAARRQAT